MLSVIIPSYNEEAMIRQAADALRKLLDDEKISFELLFVDDGSKDRTWELIAQEAASDARVKGISFSRNFGKESAIYAGLCNVSGDCCVVIDCDMQHPPEKIVEMYRLWEQGYEIVEGVKADRGSESALHGLGAHFFYRALSDALGTDMRRASDYKLLDRKAVNVLINMPERGAFFRALSSWVGFRTTQVEYSVRERESGQSKWTTGSLFRYAIANITSFTTLPMQIVTLLGVLFFLLALVLSVIALYQYLSGTALGGFTTVVLLQCITGSVIMLSLGIIGYYISKIYTEVAGRPRYIISKRTEDNV